MIDPVDLAADEDADLAVLPPLLVGQQVGDEQGQTWTGNKQLVIAGLLPHRHHQHLPTPQKPLCLSDACPRRLPLGTRRRRAG